MLLDIDQDENKIEFSYFDEDGNVKIKEYPIDDLTNWVVCNANDRQASTEYTNWDGRPVKKGFARMLNKYSVVEFIENLPQEDQDLIFADTQPKTYFVDIEVEILDGFPSPEKAESKITAICVVTPNKTAVVLATQDLEPKKVQKIQAQLDEHFKAVDEKYTFVYKSFKSEYDLLYTFFDSFAKNMAVMSGWNFVGFDWKYLINRAKKLNINSEISSPTGKLTRNEFPMHVGIIDYMQLYREWDRTVPVKENYTLDSAAEAVVGLKKIKYNGTLQDLYEQDYDKYIFYNAVDTILVQLIHEKLKTLEIVLTLANMCKISIYKASSPVTITEGLICRKLLSINKVMAKDWNAQENRKSKQYAGAYVKKPIVGIHRAVACFDFASLYPSIMRQMNISPDSLIDKIPPEYNKLREPLKEHLDNVPNSSKISVEKRKELIDKLPDDAIISVTGTVYSGEESHLKQIIGTMYDQRKMYKGKSFEHKMKIAEIEKELKSR